MAIKRRTNTKTPPVFSHEFVIQNHADIVSCIAMVFVVGFFIPATAKYATAFITLQHNVTEIVGAQQPVLFSYGPRDTLFTFFCVLIAIVLHAILQEYGLDRFNRKMHLSKVKNSKFNESGQLIVFYIISFLWAFDIIRNEGLLLNISALWDGYPHMVMSFSYKFFFIVQIAYWIHCYPELYFQKTKKEEMAGRIVYSTLYLAFFLAAYLLHFTRLALVLSALHFLAESVYHAARLLHFSAKESAAKATFRVWNGLFLLVRLVSIILATLTFWYGLSSSDNISFVLRINSLAATCLVQAYLLFNFVTFQLKRWREERALISKSKSSPKRRQPNRKSKSTTNETEDISDLPEVDQNAKRNKVKRS